VIVLIEWKYTEVYSEAKTDSNGRRIPDSADKRRMLTYTKSVWDQPWNPVNRELASELDAFLVEPIYQLFRQQSLAAAMEAAGEATRVVCLHLSPAGNTALHRITSPALARHGTDVFEVWRRLLVRPDRFRAITTQQFFAPMLGVADPPQWWSYIVDRYRGVVNG